MHRLFKHGVKRVLGLDFFVFYEFKLAYFLPYHVNVYCKKSKKNYYEKLCNLVKLVFDVFLALGNYILNNRAKSTIETVKGLEFVQW